MLSSKIHSLSVGGDVKVIGEPFQTSTDELIDTYRSSSLDEFLKTEARSSAGAYLILDPTRECVISSPGYSGGYLSLDDGASVSTTLQPLLSETGYRDLEVDSRIVEHYVKHGLTSRLPITSMFSRISRLPPATVASVSNSGVNLQSYAAEANNPPETFANAIEEATASLSHADDGVTLLFSGGADSTALYCALSETINEENLTTVSVDIGTSTNGVERARTVGSALDIDYQELEFGWPPAGDRVLKSIENQLSQDFVSPLAPHHALAADSSLPKTVVSGQNFDAMSVGDMSRPQINPIQHFRVQPEFTSALKTAVQNFQYTKYYVQSAVLQRAYCQVIPRLRPDESVTDVGVAGYIKGMYSTYLPNIINASEADLISEEVDRVLEAVGRTSPVLSCDLANYYNYMANASKVISTQSVRGRTTHLLAMWGPLASYYLGRDRGVRSFVSPKHEILSYIRSKTGRSYTEIAYSSLQEYQQQLEREQEHKERMISDLLIRNREMFDYESSAVLPLINPTLRKTLTEQYSNYEDSVETGLTFSELRKANRILNLEMILQSVQE